MRSVTDRGGIDCRQLRITVAHPRDSDGEVLFRYLQRLDCDVDQLWPAPDECRTGADVVFCSIEPQTRAFCASLLDRAETALVGIADAMNPRTVQLLGELSPLAVLLKPVEPGAILTNLVVARNNARYQRRLQNKIAKLEETLRSVRKVERAKSILMAQRQISESEAYAYLRNQAMKKRLPIGTIASVVVESSDVLSGEKD